MTRTYPFHIVNMMVVDDQEELAALVLIYFTVIILVSHWWGRTEDGGSGVKGAGVGGLLTKTGRGWGQMGEGRGQQI